MREVGFETRDANICARVNLSYCVRHTNNSSPVDVAHQCQSNMSHNRDAFAHV